MGLATASALLAASLVVGVPALLVWTGGRGPATVMLYVVTRPRLVPHLLGEGLTAGAVLGGAWVVAWLVWAWFSVCLGLELRSRLGGRAPRRVPASAPMQSLVAGLVSATIALAPSVRLASSFRLQASAQRPTVVVQTPGTPASTAAVPVVPVSAAPAASPVERVYVVRPGDTLWSIAQRELGSPLRWREIGSLNYGHPQPDGGSLTDDHWIRPGWRFVLPAAGDTPGGHGMLAPDVVPPTGAALGAPVSDAASAAFEAAAFHIGRDLAGAPGEDPSDDAARSSVAPEGIRVATSSVPGHGPDQHRSPPFPVVPVGYGLLGAGVVALLDRMRRAQQRRRPEGLRIALPSADLADLERGLRASADHGAVEWIDLALRLLVALARRHNAEPPAVWGVRLGEHSVEVLIDPASGGQAFPPFVAGPGDTSWVLDRIPENLQALHRDDALLGIDPPHPSLVTLGRDDTGIVLIDVERAGSIAVSGDDAGLVLEAVAVELATARWADQVDVLLIGFTEFAHGFERVTLARSIEAVVARMERRTRERQVLLALSGRTSNVDTRSIEGGDAWDLTVVVCSGQASAKEPAGLRRLVEVAGDGRLGLAVVAASDVLSARWHVVAEDGRIRLVGVPSGVPSVSRQPTPVDLVAGVGELASIAAQSAAVVPDESPYDQVSMHAKSASTQRVGEAPPPSGDPGREVQVRVLGPVEIHGAERPFTRAWAVELVVYLAMHRAGVSNEQWAAALWPDRIMAPASLHSTASAARRALGVSSSGDDHLPRARGRLALGPDVDTDWEQLSRLAASDHPDDWRQALQFVRGRPFEGLRAADWVVLEGIEATIEAVVVDLGCRLARHCLDALDPAGAQWAARQALRVSPYDERLYRELLRAADASGNPAGVESIMAELVHLIAEDVEPFDAVHPETWTLYRNLSRRSLASHPR